MSESTERRFPDFLGIGAQRGGSSWLYSALSHHPDVWMPPVKEIHYFDKPRVGERCLGYLGKAGLVRLRDYMDGTALRTSGDGIWANLSWDLHYMFGRRGPEWYIDLFRPHSGQLTGEITPAYGILDEETVHEIYRLNPELKVFLVLREPIARAWSSVVNNLGKKMRRNIANANFNEIVDRVEKPGFQLRCDYARTIRMWRSVLGEDRVFIGYMEEIKADPAALFDRVCDFLGIQHASDVVLPQLVKSVNTTLKYNAPISDELQRYLAATLMPMINETAELLGGYAEEWRVKARGLLEDK